MEYIDNYINTVLKEQLFEFGLYNNDSILDDVKNKMYSLLNNWKDKDFINAVLISGVEEAEFYQPKANIMIKAFVVVTVRNTLIESAGSSFYKNFNYDVQISDTQMKEITKKAIVYFKDKFFEFNNIKFNFELENDYFKSASEEFKVAFELLKILGNLNKREIYFDKIPINKENLIQLSSTNTNIVNHQRYVEEDGVSEEFNNRLILSLQYSINSGRFFVDSFKVLTRNYRKLLKVIQYLIERDSKFLTFNYYISNGYISKRKEVLKPLHSVSEMTPKFLKNKELSPKHKQCLDEIRITYLNRP